MYSHTHMIALERSSRSLINCWPIFLFLDAHDSLESCPIILNSIIYQGLVHRVSLFTDWKWKTLDWMIQLSVTFQVESSIVTESWTCVAWELDSSNSHTTLSSIWKWRKTNLHEAAEKPFHSLVPKPLHRNRKLVSFPGPAQLSLLAVRKVGGAWEQATPL